MNTGDKMLNFIVSLIFCVGMSAAAVNLIVSPFRSVPAGDAIRIGAGLTLMMTLAASLNRGAR